MVHYRPTQIYDQDVYEDYPMLCYEYDERYKITAFQKFADFDLKKENFDFLGLLGF